jgi:hypothetical protein
MTYSDWMCQVEMYLGDHLSYTKWVLFFDLWFHCQEHPRYAATWYKRQAGLLP